MKINSVQNYEQNFSGTIVQPKKYQEEYNIILKSVIANGDQDEFAKEYEKFSKLPMKDRKYHWEIGRCCENKPVVVLYDTEAESKKLSGCAIESKCAKSYPDDNIGKAALDVLKEINSNYRDLLFKCLKLEAQKDKILAEYDSKQLENYKKKLDTIF